MRVAGGLVAGRLGPRPRTIDARGLAARPGRSRGRFAGLAWLFVLSTALGTSLTLAPLVASDVLAAGPDLTMTSDATYLVQPDKARVHITLDAVAVSHTQDSVTQRYYFSGTFITVLPGTTGFSATSGSTRLAVHVSRRTKDYVLLSVDFDHRVYSGQSYSFRVQFDLPDSGGPPTRDVRVGNSLVAFPVWAFASANTAGSTVRVVLPAGFQAEPDAGDLPAPTTSDSGETVYQSASLSKPLDFYAYVMADRAGAFGETLVRAAVGDQTADVLVKAWSDDPAWGTQVADLFRRGLPVLNSLIGLQYPRTGELTVEEAVSRSLGGYSGLFDPTTSRVQVAYYATPFVVLHEAAHAWFNSDLASDRWIDEAFASYYAQLAAAKLGIHASGTTLTPDLLKSRIQLNDWGAIGREDPKVEDYAYAATLQLAGLIGQRAGTQGLTSVWRAAAKREAAYQPVHGGDTESSILGAPDWRVLLDLLEERTGSSYTDLWRTWVVRSTDAPLLDDREAARSDYRSTIALAGTWELPAAIRDALGAWQFDEARSLLTDARDALALRSQIEARERADGLQVPATLRHLFESSVTLDPARTEARRELDALAAIEAAHSASAAHRTSGVANQLGVLGENPDAALARADEAFAAGNMGLAIDQASLARAVWTGAGSVGRFRLAALIGGSIALAILLIALIVVWRRRRHRNQLRAALAALSAASAASVAADPREAAYPAAGADGLDADPPLEVSFHGAVPPGAARSDQAGRYATLPPDPRGGVASDAGDPRGTQHHQGGGDPP